ncbi:apolipoprotein L3-like [Polyodon spathula]|uniref:apolipoprotein L3-like n=1 Tax=Polyodon spathula TaxID=7913 RepID=UPI001B7EF103|nr:apolipoprotein L3-like [Polyodon spathula]
MRMGQQAGKSKLQGKAVDRTSGEGRNSTEYKWTNTSEELLESEDSSIEAEDLSSDLIEQFIQLFSEKKLAIEGYLKQLNEIADGLDEVNKNSAIAKTTGSCVSVAGGVMTIAGLVLAPFTLGASTLLAGVGLGVGVLGGATAVGTEITKAVIDGGENEKVAEILKNIESAMSQLDKSVGKACHTVSKWDENGFEKIVKATGQLGVKGASAASALSRVVRVSLSKGARIAGGVVAGVFVALDVYDIAKNSIDIHQGCKSERAKEIRKLVETTKSDLAELEDVCSDMKKLRELREADLDRTVRRRRHGSECDLTDLTEELEKEPQGSSLTMELDPENRRTREKETRELPVVAEAVFPVRIIAKVGAALGLSVLAVLAILSTEDPISVGVIVLMLLLLVLLVCLTVQLSWQIQ